jgi:electron transfer flavoprotein alpha subunit
MASIVSPGTRPQTATVRPKVFQARVCRPGRSARVQDHPVVLNPAMIRTRVVEQAAPAGSGGPCLEEAGVIVAAGRGCSTEAGLGAAERLAQKLRGVLACTRPLVEDGLFPHTRQVGQSGITVGPDLYLALGISGAVQHRVGMSSAKTVIAVNRDPGSPMLAMADLGVVGDAAAVAEAVASELDRRRSKGPGTT